MEYRQLGRSGVRVSKLCLGTMNFGGRTDEKTAIGIVHEALDAGINFIDAADVYAKGVSEEIVGKAIAQSGRRDEVVLATKAVARMGDGPNDRGASRYHLTRACEASLRRLKTDRIDLFYLHVVDMTTPVEEILNTLETLVRQGKILYIGTSKWPVPLIMEALALSERGGLPRIVAEQPPYHLLDRSIENELVWTCMRHGIGLVTFSPLAGGFLSGKYRKGEKPPEGSRYEKVDSSRNKRFAPETLDVVEKLLVMAEAKGITLSELAHAWLMQRPGITAPIVGPRTVEHLKAALKACEVELSDEERTRIDEIVPPGSTLIDHYNALVYGRMCKAVNAGDPMRY
ncbi:MAG: aldo/keto reductase [Candidatus Latescibacteria bacterium 4484_107]|nr:MAG: aldo/keto reductase [Candidatus Latescibacteria bacterium 4484_107]